MASQIKNGLETNAGSERKNIEKVKTIKNRMLMHHDLESFGKNTGSNMNANIVDLLPDSTKKGIRTSSLLSKRNSVSSNPRNMVGALPVGRSR